MTNCKIIVIEGIDGSGKTFQLELLKNKLISLNKTYHELSFPVYSSFFGKEIGNMLSGKFDITATNVDAKSMSLWYAADRLLSLKNLVLDNYDFLLLNRYTLSNAVYQGIRYNGDLNSFAKWIFELEYDQLKLPKPQLYFILDVTKDISNTNVIKKGFRDYTGNNADVYENSSNIIKSARNLYLQFAEQMDNIKIINCMSGKNMKHPNTIHEEILETIKINKLL